MKSIDEIRSRIDEIDDKIAALFKERMTAVGEIAEYKKTNNIPLMSESRERNILYRVTDITGSEFENYTKILYNTIFDLSRNYQSKKLAAGGSKLGEKITRAINQTPPTFPTKATVACQGIEGAYSQQVCSKLFPIPQILYFNRFEGVLMAVQNGMCKYGILPIENSSNGSVSEVYDLMVKYKFYIVRSMKLKIEHCLLVKPGTKLSDIRKIVSHEQALSQCSDFFKKHPEIKVSVLENTAAAAKYVSESEKPDIAAIASSNCAQLYGLSIIQNSVQNNEHNYTRFICISKSMEIYPGANKISFMASAEHKPGTLYSLISKFNAESLNLSKLESRPIPGKDFKFRFYFDVEASVWSDNTLNILSQFENDESFVFLGSYADM